MKNNEDRITKFQHILEKYGEMMKKPEDKTTNKESFQLSAVDRCYELIKDKHANWLGISNQEAIKEVLSDRENYLQLYQTALVKSLNEYLKDKRKYESDMELLNEGWKQELKDYINKDTLRSMLINKTDELKKSSNDRWESDEEKYDRLIIEIKLLKTILGEKCEITNDKEIKGKHAK